MCVFLKMDDGLLCIKLDLQLFGNYTGYQSLDMIREGPQRCIQKQIFFSRDPYTTNKSNLTRDNNREYFARFLFVKIILH